MKILELVNVVKKYGSKTAVDHVSFSIPEGSIFGLLGPNGAGKTSLIRIITTITGADEGNVLFMGEPLNLKHPALIGYMPEERGLYKKMKVGEHLIYLAGLKGIREKVAIQLLKEWFTKFQIEDWWNKKVEELSKGMQQKVQFVATVVHKPRLLILDEPFSGLDPINANLIQDELFRLHKEGTSIIFSTHRMEQVEEICDEIVLINNGKIILQGNVGKIKQQFKGNLYGIEYSGEANEQSLAGLDVVEKSGTQFIVKSHESSANELLKELINRNINIIGFREILPGLNDIFIKQVEISNKNN